MKKKQILFCTLCVLLCAAAFLAGRGTRMHRDAALIHPLRYEFPYTHCIIIEDQLLREQKTVLDEEGLDAWRKKQSEVFWEETERGLSSEEATLRIDKIPFREAKSVTADKRTIYEFFGEKNLREADLGKDAREWRFRLEFILRDHTNTMNPAVSFDDDFDLLLDEHGVLICDRTVYYDLGKAKLDLDEYRKLLD
ncbi:MAG: hypothetical protein E7458_08545 [Ruminococcaceae bacterium]|nr:hypothetical protein [Oscillospiraceae bacterium]